jgi:hypothetical protein
MNSLSLDFAGPSHAECRRVRERAEMIIAQARLLCEQLDQTGGLLGFEVQAHAVATEFAPRVSVSGSHSWASLNAA